MGASDTASIMIVDDTPENLALLASMLGDAGHRVLAFPSAKMALAAAERRPPDLVLLDICMPQMDGFDLARCFKANPALADIPILFLSALSETAEKVTAFAVGGVDYIVKPVQVAEVQVRVETHLRIRRLAKSLAEQNRALEQALARIAELATRDELTGLLNRRATLDRLRELHALAAHQGAAESLVFVDIDHFKRVNDERGHVVGDAVLAVAAKRLKSGAAAADVVGRWGGEEFLVALRQTDASTAVAAAEKLRARLGGEPIEAGGVRHAVTGSFGVATLRPGEGLDAWIERADRACLDAKRAGRDRVIVAP
jgi:diguanylate cyclase (GGDEF)-like protein